jgi:hypothetical protein
MVKKKLSDMFENLRQLSCMIENNPSFHGNEHLCGLVGTAGDAVFLAVDCAKSMEADLEAEAASDDSTPPPVLESMSAALGVTCPICYEAVAPESKVTLGCHSTHWACEVCVNAHVQYSTKCFICKQQISEWRRGAGAPLVDSNLEDFEGYPPGNPGMGYGSGNEEESTVITGLRRLRRTFRAARLRQSDIDEGERGRLAAYEERESSQHAERIARAAARTAASVIGATAVATPSTTATTATVPSSLSTASSSTPILVLPQPAKRKRTEEGEEVAVREGDEASGGSGDEAEPGGGLCRESSSSADGATAVATPSTTATTATVPSSLSTASSSTNTILVLPQPAKSEGGDAEQPPPEGALPLSGEEVTMVAGDESDWQQAMLTMIARGEMPQTPVEDGKVPKSVCKALKESGEGSMLVAFTPETFSALGVPAVKYRAYASRLILQLFKRVGDTTIEIWQKHLAPPGGSTKYSWFILKDSDRNALAEKANATSVRELSLDVDRDIKGGHAEKIRADVLRALDEQGIGVCQHCTMPLLSPDDPHFDAKKKIILDLTQRGAGVTPCACGVSHVVHQL